MTDAPDNIWDRRSFAWPIGTHGVTVVEIGGFEGRWVSEMGARHTGTFHTFEPQPWANIRALAAFRQARRPGETTFVQHEVALGDRDGVFSMGGWETDACSFLLDDGFYERNPEEGRRARGDGRMQRVEAVWPELGPRIDVAMMNIEGYEFHLLPRMIAHGIIETIDFLAVQFHTVHDPSGAQERGIRAALERTHDIFFDYGDTLVAFVRKGALER